MAERLQPDEQHGRPEQRQRQMKLGEKQGAEHDTEGRVSPSCGRTEMAHQEQQAGVDEQQRQVVGLNRDREHRELRLESRDEQHETGNRGRKREVLYDAGEQNERPDEQQQREQPRAIEADDRIDAHARFEAMQQADTQMVKRRVVEHRMHPGQPGQPRRILRVTITCAALQHRREALGPGNLGTAQVLGGSDNRGHIVQFEGRKADELDRYGPCGLSCKKVAEIAVREVKSVIVMTVLVRRLEGWYQQQ